MSVDDKKSYFFGSVVIDIVSNIYKYYLLGGYEKEQIIERNE